jgi:hypothetical protein
MTLLGLTLFLKALLFISISHDYTASFRNFCCASTADLRKALQLSGGKGKVAANAYCQRGALYRKVRQLSWNF